MPTNNKRVNLTLPPDIYRALCRYRDEKYPVDLWGVRPLASVVTRILREALRDYM